MKNKILTVFFIALSIPLRAQFLKAELEVNGFTCSMCALSTQKSLNTLGFIQDIKPDIGKNLYFLQFKSGSEVNLDALKTKVKASGFSVGKLVALFHFEKPIKGSDFDYQGNTYHIEKYDQRELKGDIRFQIIDKDFLSPKTFKSFNIPMLEPGTLKTRKLYHLIIA